MIILNLNKINRKIEKNKFSVKKILNEYTKINNFGLLECPCCNSTNIIRWGFYERNVYFFHNNNVTSSILKIQRVKCKSCGKTHALLPFGIIPYKQFSDEVITKIIYLSLNNNNIDTMSSLFLIDINTINKWIIQFKFICLSRISTLLKSHNNKNSIIEFLNSCYYKIKYIYDYNACFMQIKLGSLGLCPSIDGLPT